MSGFHGNSLEGLNDMNPVVIILFQLVFLSNFWTPQPTTRI